MKPKDVFNKTTEFLEGKQTSRPIRDASPPSPPSLPGEPLRNRRGDLIFAQVTNASPFVPVDSDENPTLYPLTLDTSGNLRVILPNGTTLAANVNLTAVGGAPITEGQKTMANSVPVVIASDQTTIPVTVTFPATQDVNLKQVGGAAVSLGAKTSANSIPVVLATDEATLPVSITGQPIADNLTQVGGAAVTLGTKTSANSIPVVLASDEATLPVLITAQPISDNLTQVGGTAVSLGSKTSANSIPVVIASDQADVNINLDKAGGTAVDNFSGGLIRPALPITFVGVGGQAAISADGAPGVRQVVNNTALGDNSSNTTSLGVGVTTAGVLDAFKNWVYVSLFNGTSWDRQRTPSIFKSATAAASGSTALWTPAAGKKVRLMRFKIQITGDSNIAAATKLTVKLLDAAVDIGVGHIVNIPATATLLATSVNDGYDSGWIILDNGYLSVLANNVLNINLSSALAGGLVNVIACGTEE
jgi:hypothetical protein